MAIPTHAMWVTEVLALLLLCLVTQNIRYRRILPLTFGFLFASLYIILLFVTVYIESFVEDKYSVIYWITNLFGFACMFVYLADILCICFSRVIQVAVISGVLSMVIAICDVLILPNAWFLNDVVAICVAGAIIKFIVIKKLKTATVPLFILWIFFLIRQFAVTFHI